ncbi:MAG: DUF1573 domain-containing protein [Bacteroidales bacterium]|jgi:hypothetical protein|nr:DUF1573 domain-containing protein [Bacteroidales bacterium]MBR5352226.1 DUF1573 domain-containing protein [Bacteroidales bacterium]
MKKTLASTLLLLSLLLAAACADTQKNGDIDVDLINNPNSAQGYDQSARVPKITFDSDLHDFGRITSGESISYSFHFRNTGDADLVLSGCSATCGCTVADYPRGRIAPGKEGYVTVTFNSQGKTGQQYQEVTVTSNAQPGRNILKITAQVTY